MFHVIFFPVIIVLDSKRKDLSDTALQRKLFRLDAPANPASGFMSAPSADKPK
jgi:hypothetical protein